VLGEGHPWQTALGASLFSGLIFLLLTLFKIRETIMHAIPQTLRHATTAGIGLFLAFIGLRNVGIVSSHETTLVTFGKLASPEAILTGLGILVIGILTELEIKGAMLVAIILNWLIGLTLGLVKWKGLIAAPPSLAPTFLKLDILGSFSPEYLP